MSDSKPKVLVIDDEKGLRDMLVYGLGGRGYEVGTAENGRQAVEKAHETAYDLAVCDLMMPEMGGVDTLKALKEVLPNIEVVMVTGYATLETAVESMKHGAYDYITKPYELEQLCNILQKAVERGRLRAKVGELEQISRMKSEFLANMSHELRTPLNAIVGYSSLILDEVYGGVPPAQKDALERVLLSSKNLLALINDILDFSKLNAGMMPTHIEEFDLGFVAREVADTMQALALQKKLTLTTETDGPLMVRSDKTKLKQIIINLVGNALKFTEQGGVTVRAVRAAGDGVVLGVRDTGPGMAAADLTKIFVEFKQLDGASTRKHGGTGLGLSISKRLSELLGGKIEVTSEVGKGSEFVVRLPGRVAQTGPLETPVAIASAPASEPKRVLLAIDDDPEVLRLLRDSLSGTGYTMVGASSGEEGLALARKIKPFVITLDIMMPHRDGWSVLQALKNDPETRAIPVIILSIMENKALGFSLGVSDYIVKPFERNVLIERLERLEETKGKRVLVVDDEEDIRDLIQVGLKNDGYSVAGAARGREALAAIAKDPPDILFLDLNLPDMTGFDILAELDRSGAAKDMRIFILTAQNLSLADNERLRLRVERVFEKGTMSLSAILEGLKERLLAMAGA